MMSASITSSLLASTRPNHQQVRERPPFPFCFLAAAVRECFGSSPLIQNISRLPLIHGSTPVVSLEEIPPIHLHSGRLVERDLVGSHSICDREGEGKPSCKEDIEVARGTSSLLSPSQVLWIRSSFRLCERGTARTNERSKRVKRGSEGKKYWEKLYRNNKFRK